ncbi:MAG: hypothetical protein FWG14_12995 [Peptococcaceae bacterium]|nr:hypothetical protein [Peptococcaceae bacterium]
MAMESPLAGTSRITTGEDLADSLIFQAGLKYRCSRISNGFDLDLSSGTVWHYAKGIAKSYPSCKQAPLSHSLGESNPTQNVIFS